ncbi:MAG: DegT/DnrJ/EryC1/StrS family aminotransferase, partial [Alphaproteobacteria bacterium]
ARAEVVWEKGTNRRSFFRGEIDKYEWVDVGSSYLPSEIIAAILSVQLVRSHEIVAERRTRWARYHGALADLERKDRLLRPSVPAHCEHNGHLYYAVMPDSKTRTAALKSINAGGIRAMFHYVPLHSAPAGRRFGRTSGSLDRTADLAARIIRLPLYVGMTDAEQDGVVDALQGALARL